MKNIILIGMPGCGKSTLGRLLSDELGLEFIDLDEYVVEKNNMIIEEMFQRGEKFFRDKESEVVRDMQEKKNAIISTGGGVIKRLENINCLKRYGYIIFINRSPEKIIETIDTDMRPLLKSGREKIFQLYDERIHLYEKYCDAIIENNGNINTTINELKGIILTSYNWQTKLYMW